MTTPEEALRGSGSVRRRDRALIFPGDSELSRLMRSLDPHSRGHVLGAGLHRRLNHLVELHGGTVRAEVGSLTGNEPRACMSMSRT